MLLLKSFDTVLGYVQQCLTTRWFDSNICLKADLLSGRAIGSKPIEKSILFYYTPVVQWRGHESSKLRMVVRFLPGVPIFEIDDGIESLVR